MSVSKIVVRRYGNEPPRLVRKLRRASSVAPKPDDNSDPDLEAEYKRQVEESDGFDVDECPYLDGGIFPYVLKDKYDYPFETGLFGRLGLHCYNLDKGTNLKLIGVNQHHTEMTGVFVNYITLEAMDTCNNFPCNFQTCVARDIVAENASLKVETQLSRLKVPTGRPRATHVGFERRWENEAVDAFYKGKLPSWSAQDKLAGDKGQLHELQPSDLQENEWLHLYAEFAFHLKWTGYGKGLKAFLPLKFNKVTIQTHESGEESPNLIRARNAIFYMSFKGNGDPSGMSVEYRAIVRRTMDGMPGHIRLEVDCLAYKSS
uniref:UPF0725 protein n=1 Tax=Noccaea caerulescens TaxID=107243 RepID=A0A1J3ISG1_NOCCA